MNSINASEAVLKPDFVPYSDGKTAVFAEMLKQKRNDLYYSGKNEGESGINAMDSAETWITEGQIND